MSVGRNYNAKTPCLFHELTFFACNFIVLLSQFILKNINASKVLYIMYIQNKIALLLLI